MRDGIEILDVLRQEIPDILPDGRNPRRIEGAEGAPLIQVGIDADDVVSGRSQDLGKNAADIAVVAGDQNTHVPTPRPAREPSRSPRGLAENVDPSACPCIARSAHACRPSTAALRRVAPAVPAPTSSGDRKSTRLNSSH